MLGVYGCCRVGCFGGTVGWFVEVVVGEVAACVGGRCELRVCRVGADRV